MKIALLLLLFSVPACSEPAPPIVLDDGFTVPDGSVRTDGAGLDAFGLDAFDPTSDGAPPTDDTMVVVIDADAAMGDDDTGVVLVPDGGGDAGVDGGPTMVAECGDGYIDPPETCDPSYVGGSHSSMSCPSTGTGACSWCRLGRFGTGCVYGDYLEEPRTPGWTFACRDSAQNDLSWVVWHTGAERIALISAYRDIGAAGGSTDVYGWIGLRAPGDGMTLVWEDDGTPLNADTFLAFRNTRTAGANCAALTVNDTEAYLTYVPCTGTTRTGLCVTQPWGIPR